MVIAVILAGGTGERMGAPIPKQFIKVLGKPVIVYTLQVFEANSNIDAIEVVTLPAYINEVEGYKDEYKITKLRHVEAGGPTAQESISNGVLALAGRCADDDIIMLAMSVSPLITDDIIEDSLTVCRKYGNAVAGVNSIYNISTLKDGYWANNYILKENHVTLNLPWTFPFGKLFWAYKKARDENIGVDIVSYTTTLMVDLGENLYFSKDSQANKLKITTFDDIDMLEGYLLINELRAGNSEVIKKIRKQKDSV